MPHQIAITDNEVKDSASVLLSSTEAFDDERVAFIKSLHSLDLQACPGSGKTTCLLAKLLILGKHLPFATGQGILVLSHTNAAIKEIRERTSDYVPDLFKYPNYVGTIQSFVDFFLAIPFYSQKYGHQPIRIDDEIFNERIWEPRAAIGWLNNQRDKDDFLKSLRLDIDGKLISGIDGTATRFRLKNPDSNTYKALLRMKEKVMEDGFLCFDDAYYLAESYILIFPKIASLIQSRFKFVFIDEMQDTDVHQIRLLDKIFPDTCDSVVQRIGDQNQAIYSGNVKSDSIWTPKSGYLTLNGSKRLSQSISDTVKNISLSPQELVGNITRTNIPPHMILFDDDSIHRVVPKFAELIVSNSLHIKDKGVFKVVGWRKKVSRTGGKGIESYFVNPLPSKTNIDFKCLNEYLCVDLTETSGGDLNILRQSILNALVKILRLAEIQASNGKSFTAQSLVSFLKENYADEYEILKLNIYNWSRNIIREQDVKTEVVLYVKNFLEVIFSVVQVNEAVEHFLNSSPTSNEATIQLSRSQQNSNINYQINGIEVKIEVNTIHSVKGETHTATLYLETYYQNDGGKSYESQRLIEQLKGHISKGTEGLRFKQSQKMMYVGLTRATDLVCFAAHKIHISEVDENILKTKWSIIDLTTISTQ